MDSNNVLLRLQNCRKSSVHYADSNRGNEAFCGRDSQDEGIRKNEGINFVFPGDNILVLRYGNGGKEPFSFTEKKTRWGRKPWASSFLFPLIQNILTLLVQFILDN